MAYYNCLLFDADGTLLDFAAAQRKALTETLTQFDLPADEETLAQYRTINEGLWAALERGEIRQEKLLRERFLRLVKLLGSSASADEMNRSYESNLANHADLIPGALEVLKELSEVATIAIISNGFEKVQKSRLEASGIAGFVDAIFLSEKVGAVKPGRKFFDAALAHLGVESRDRVLVIGDSLKADIAGGQGAGLATCWFDELNSAEEPAPKPTHIIHALEELYPIIMEEEELADVGNQNRKHQN